VPAPSHAEGPWVHGDDATRAPTGVRRGWHDAGDFSLYNMTAVSTVFWLLEAFNDFAPMADATNIPESNNGVPDLLDEARWELEWLLSVQDVTGGFRNTTCLQAYQAYGRNLPEQTARYVHGEVGTVPTARAVGALAYASVVYAPFDGAFARLAREAAWRGWRYLEARPLEHSDGPTCPAYRQDGDPRVGRAVRMFAAAGMLLATGERQFHDAFDAHFEDITGDPSPYRVNAYAGLLYLRAPAGDDARRAQIRSRLREHADAALADGARHPFEWAGRYIWGSIAAGFERTGGFSAKICLADPVRDAPHCGQALANVDYALGRNYLHYAYVSGLPGVSRGRRHVFHHWLATLRAEPFVFPGMVAGGPNESPMPNDGSRPRARPVPIWGYWGDAGMPRDASTPVEGRYTDNDSWSTNEVDIAWQGVTLYNLYFAQWLSRRSPQSGATPP
jgi:endoglucanase